MKRAIFYDDCRSGDRLAREYTQIMGAAPLIVEYQSDIGKFAYTVTSVGGGACRWAWKSTQSMQSFEAQFLIKKHSVSGGLVSWGGFWPIFDLVDNNNLTEIQHADIFYFIQTRSAVTFAEWWAGGITNDIWYNFKVRRIGRDGYLKIWAYGTSEPAWQFYSSLAPTGGNEIPTRFKFRPGNFGIGTYFVGVGDWSKIADIRITPIPRTGFGGGP